MIASALAGLLLVACASTSSQSTGGASPSASTNFALQVATTDLYAGTAQRVQVGVFGSTDQGVQLLTGGSIPLSLVAADGGAPITGTADYVPAPGTPSTTSPGLTPASQARGVYELSDVTFPSPGVWQAQLSFTAGGQPVDLTSSFTVADKPAYPAPGQPALKTVNLTMADKGNPQAIDSRAQDGAPVPDPELHQDTIAGAIAAHRAALVLFATPVYCTSQFCGPTTDALQQLAKTGPSTADYIHVEIYNDYSTSTINKAAGDWLLRNGDLTEPWLYLIGPDGTIVDRWSPLFDPAEVRAELQRVAG
jgi:type 1 fimbria pilin